MNASADTIAGFDPDIYRAALDAVDKAARGLLKGAARTALRALLAVCYGPRSAGKGYTAHQDGRPRPVAYRVLSTLMRSGQSEDTVARAVRHLVSAKLVTVVGRTRDGMIYAVDLKATMKLEPRVPDEAVRPSERARRDARRADMNAALDAAVSQVQTPQNAVPDPAICGVQSSSENKESEETTAARASSSGHRDPVVEAALDRDPRDQVVEAALDRDPRDQVDQVGERARFTLHTQGRPSKPAEPQQQDKAPLAPALKGCDPNVVEALVTKWGAGRVSKAIAVIDRRVAAGKAVDNPGGYLRFLCASDSDLEAPRDRGQERERQRVQKIDAEASAARAKRRESELQRDADAELDRRHPEVKAARKMMFDRLLDEDGPEHFAEWTRLRALYAPELDAIKAEMMGGPSRGFCEGQRARAA